VDRGFWLEMPTTERQVILPEQFEEMYRTSLDFVKPVSIVTNALSILSGYSVGYRMATWPRSLSAPQVQERSWRLEHRRIIAARREARAAQPVMAAGKRRRSFRSSSSTPRHTNFFKLAIADSTGLSPGGRG
jgi:hypothetical protein